MFTFQILKFLKVHVIVLKETIVVHVSEDPITNVNETIKAPQDLSTSKDKVKQSSGLVLTSFELDPSTTSTHVLGKNDLDHVLKNYI